ncbi:peptidylprolyl isomerase [Curvibacter gracilis]|uniref:peptidylprolyl isomerase n=1 Tax=Curvibacter gracilis TaxID=230310 RepID=UPI0006841A5C|nr:peptidylprolyl isomerase [Curvibacter gracilis]
MLPFQFKSSWMLSSLAAVSCGVLLGVVSLGAQAQDDAFIQKPVVLLTAPGIEVTTLDVLAEMQRVPADQRAGMLTKPETVGQIVQNIFLRRALTQTADKQGIGQTPLLLRLNQLNRERLVTDAYLEFLDKKNELNLADAEKLAAVEYKVNPKSFEAPEEVEASHILIRFGDDKAAAKAKAEAILAELKNGADFATVAKEKSEDPGSGAKGGDLGRFGRGRMVKPFEDAAFALKKPGELSGLVESQFGYHILKLKKHDMVRVRAFADVKEELVKSLQQKSIVDGRKLEAERLNNEASIQGDALKRFVDAYKPAEPAQTEAKPAEASAAADKK